MDRKQETEFVKRLDAIWPAVVDAVHGKDGPYISPKIKRKYETRREGYLLEIIAGYIQENMWSKEYQHYFSGFISRNAYILRMYHSYRPFKEFHDTMPRVVQASGMT